MTDPPYDFLRIVETFARHRVRFVVIGGIAGRMHGSPSITQDVDVCYARDDENLEHMAAALRELGAKLRGAPDDVPFQLDARALEMGDHFTFSTDAGDLDILGTPSGSQGFDELSSRALDQDVLGYTVRAAHIDDLIRMKLAAGRPKDRIEVEILGALRDEIRREESES